MSNKQAIRKLIIDIQDRLDVFLELLDGTLNNKDELEGNVSLQPHPYYESMYGYVNNTGIEGLYSTPAEYYSGSIADDVNPITNPYNGTYGLASTIDRIKIRKESFIQLKMHKKVLY